MNTFPILGRSKRNAGFAGVSDSIVSVLFTIAVSLNGCAGSHLKEAWKTLALSTHSLGGWADGPGEHYGQICDPYRQPGGRWPINDEYDGCAVVFIADRGDAFTVGNLPANQRNNFQNTQHYHAAYSFHGTGFKSTSLPRPGSDIDPVCYVAMRNGTKVLGYEEGNGDRLLPCPGAIGGYVFTPAQIEAASHDELQEMCSMCYQGVCSANSARVPRACGNTGGLVVGEDDAEDGALNPEQVGSAYHCHLTMANRGACDYVQFDQHEESREYNMSSAVLCGWERVRALNITYCDCTAEAGTPNNCQREHCLSMALNGVVCGNCNSCSQSKAYDQIFGVPGEPRGDAYLGVCALASTASTEAERAHYQMLCSQGLFCRRYRADSGCNFHCARYGGQDVDICPQPEDTNTTQQAGGDARRLLSTAEAPDYTPIPRNNIVIKPILAISRSRKQRLM